MTAPASSLTHALRAHAETLRMTFDKFDAKYGVGVWKLSADVARDMVSQLDALLRQRAGTPTPAKQRCAVCGHTMHEPDECRICNGCEFPVAQSGGTEPAPTPDYWRCRTCGCVWRDNHDDSISLGSAKQTSCDECEMKPIAQVADPLAVIKPVAAPPTTGDK